MPNESLLTVREWEVLSAVGSGYTNAQTANRLFASTATIDSHLANIMSKTDIHDRSELVWQYQSGKISRDG